MSRTPPAPTEFELEILQIVWAQGVVTVRDVSDVIGRSRSLSRTAIATTMQRMRDKGLLRITDERKPQRYAATRTREETYEASLSDLNQQYSRRSIADVVRGLLGRSKPTKSELDEVRKLLEAHKPGRRDDR